MYYTKQCAIIHNIMCKGGVFMVRFKIDVLQELKNKGYNTNRIRKEKIIPEGTLTKIRNNQGEPVTTATINILCKLLNKQPGQLLEYFPDNQENKTS